MTTPCTHCGAEATDTPFCGACGHPRTPDVGPAPEPDPTAQYPAGRPPPSAPPSGPWSEPTIVPGAAPPPQHERQAPPSTPPATPPAPAWQAPPPPQQPAWQPAPAGYQQPYQQQPPQRRPVEPRVNPFPGWPVSDYVRDAAAAFFLFATLGMPWSWSEDHQPWAKGGDVWWVVIGVLVGVAALAVPYLARARAVPGWQPPHYRLLQLGLFAPLGIGVALVLLFEVLHLGDDQQGGVGSGVAMALAGAAMALTPRGAEARPDDAQWTRAARLGGLVAAGLTAVGFVLWFLGGLFSDDARIFDPVLGFVVVLVAALVMPLAVVGWPAYAMATTWPAPPWRRVFVVVGFTVLVTALFALANDYQGLFVWPPISKWDGLLGLVPATGLLLLGAAASLAVSQAVLRAGAAEPDPVAGHVATARAALLVTAAGCAVYGVALLVDTLAREDVGAVPIVGFLLVVAAAGAAGYAAVQLRDVRRHRVLVLGGAAAVVLLGTVVMGMINSADIGQGVVGGSVFTANTGWAVAVFWSLPVLAGYSLLAPPPVRHAFGPLVTGSTAPPSGPPSGPPPGYPTGYPTGPPPGSHPPGSYPPAAPPPSPYPGAHPPPPHPPQQPPAPGAPPWGPPSGT